ncbi:MAG: hypothetical protein Q7J34_01210 [Bacteroidales bacterium]|nr:hypothetical protein [Bacteroidales bacterium]
MKTIPLPELFETLSSKGQLKQQVYKNAIEAIRLFKEVVTEIYEGYLQSDLRHPEVRFEYTDVNDFEVDMTFAGDVLVFIMHTNVFEFSRNHEVMNTPYVREDKNRSYCGVIHIYNFLSDSYTYQRDNDLGYLIGRIFINKDNYFFIEGKREVGMLYSGFGTQVLNKETAAEIVKSAMLYSINFDLLTPPFDDVKMVSVGQVKAAYNSLSITTGKRLGFKFQADTNGGHS